MWRKLNDSGAEERTLELLLRIGVAGCYVGHGAFGVIGKEAWLPYFAVVGIGPELARALMPIVGSIDILVGMVALLAPRPAVLVYAGGWAIWTALLRPLAGESVFETLERAGNYGVPIALLVLAGASWKPTRSWLRGLEVPSLTPARRRHVMLTLRATTATLLVGHGGLAFLGKPLLVEHASVAGLPEGALALVGAFEMGLAATIALRPAARLLLFVVVWKIGTEGLFPLAGAPMWELVERMGSYIAPLALWTMVHEPARTSIASRAGSAARGLTALGVVLAAGAFVTTGAPAQEASLLPRLRAGGLVLACRHAITDRSRGDSRRVDFDDPSTQRVLSEEGRAQARRLGEIIRAQGVPIGEVLTSPYARTAVSAELAFGRAEIRDALYRDGTEHRRALRRLLTNEPPPGENRALMTHQGVLYRVLPDVRRGSIREGDCMVLAPDGADFEILARLGPDEWAALGGEEHETTEAARAIAAARYGGTSIVCRHATTGSFQEREPVSYADSTTQRLLNPAGERQSRAIGRAIESLGIEVTELVASPMNRARRTAELMFGREPKIDGIWHTNGGSYGGEARAARRRVLASPVPVGNRLIVSHIGTMSSVLDDVRGRVREGDCVVVRPGGGGYEVVGVVEADGWNRSG